MDRLAGIAGEAEGGSQFRRLATHSKATGTADQHDRSWRGDTCIKFAQVFARHALSNLRGNECGLWIRAYDCRVNSDGWPSRRRFNLFDTVFAHDDFAIAGVTSQLVQWDRTLVDPKLPTFFTHEQMLRPERLRTPKNLRFGLLYESQAIIPKVYRAVETVMNDFQLVFTHSARLLENYANARWIPGSGVWVGGAVAGGYPQIEQKERNCSILTSNKLRVGLHRNRYLTAQLLKMRHSEVDTYIQPLRSRDRISVVETLARYRYSICVENFIDDRYFTEKILNCFALGTVPIYMGAKRISEYFDGDGIITYSGYRDLRRRVLPMLSPQDYESRRSAIETNFNRCLRFGSLEDFIVTEYF